eukprot:CAMPEP_0175053374 /NCGR_PEP_ID=MMETSP0052_2-20121109/8886_1 /TAXON_ID=51329 ORGANISM="Polytomella parva, Strain SAG 63-3" /NCGR_SAMPLE_ID=MMETSP0052_2 /ASSEMBLY_ACC=CAM_ASM_000194 /LENGTH=379 /DNA_ID=CAMNT_0016317895 /DNA_START=56 /DNA_END=1191 /DNA_ORIENTATION=-
MQNGESDMMMTMTMVAPTTTTTTTIATNPTAASSMANRQPPPPPPPSTHTPSILFPPSSPVKRDVQAAPSPQSPLSLSTPLSSLSPSPSSSSSTLRMQPTEIPLLQEASAWVLNWPEAIGCTYALAAFLLAGQHWGADCWYLLSDGLAHDPGQVLQLLHRRRRNNLPLPAIHCVGLHALGAWPDDRGERFLRSVAEITNGSYQRYDPSICRTWDPHKRDFVPYDIGKESAEVRTERLWAEAQLRAERSKNRRLGIQEPIDVTLDRVRQLHQDLRVDAKQQEHENQVRMMRLAYDREVARIQDSNRRRMAAAVAAHGAMAAAVAERNRRQLETAGSRFEKDHLRWERDYKRRLGEWEAMKQLLERQREEAVALEITRMQG